MFFDPGSLYSKPCTFSRRAFRSTILSIGPNRIEKLNVPAVQSLACSEKTDEHQKDRKKGGGMSATDAPYEQKREPSGVGGRYPADMEPTPGPLHDPPSLAESIVHIACGD